ncbi:MAG: MJ0042-type zinc finger domain-containing protein [Candidatus Enteromonas sp.]|nr:hypothetical protein [bacterium]MDD6917990.1 hypothetical protein [bacterium]MDY6101094.1 MJ0042-type zinc finger domain-containing protein [Candidatus Enteromonas sp.]
MPIKRKEEEPRAHISCPHCGTVFAIDESECAELLSQIKSEETEKNPSSARGGKSEPAKGQ